MPETVELGAAHSRPIGESKTPDEITRRAFSSGDVLLTRSFPLARPSG